MAEGQSKQNINVSSVHEGFPMPTNSPYCASKGGLHMLTHTIALELTPYGITVNNLAPDVVDAPMDAPLEEHRDQIKKLLSEIPLGRMGKPEEVAALAVYFASAASAHVTGSTFFIDRGMIRHAGSL